MDSLKLSALISLFIQFITGLIEVSGLFLTVTPSDMIVKDVLALELIVQVIEFMFYLYLVYKIFGGHVNESITSHRYIDWAITTPTMLVSFVIFFKYLKNPTRNIRLVESVMEDKSNILKIISANALMLLFGFLAERSIINSYVGVTLGFIPFLYTFNLLYENYVKGESTTAYRIFYILFFIWGLYGASAILPFSQKNTMYNILDLFSKNAYGIFLYIYLHKLSILQNEA